MKKNKKNVKETNLHIRTPNKSSSDNMSVWTAGVLKNAPLVVLGGGQSRISVVGLLGGVLAEAAYVGSPSRSHGVCNLHACADA